ncbi:hypothetical protein IGI04_018082 [Brassica rapa subsp. trilocularis]|uniref:Uncharacterized protein n=1 Tax=Brassica rapa subsp. trilocularis TaxID=1813537 RepID=A0ABQ7MDM7_BRACM|nr:hypothetical protein IGI04_018082 [Brassica rapa subsp. trilocularis]
MGKKAPEASFPSGEHSGFSIGFSELHGVSKPNPPQSPQRDPTPKAPHDHKRMRHHRIYARSSPSHGSELPRSTSSVTAE